jgi:hypothetical protein
MLGRWKAARRSTFLGAQRVTTDAAAMLRPDRRRHIDAVIDYFGGVRETPTALRAGAARGVARRR